MEKFDMSELAITFNMVKANGEDFTDSEIDEFNEEFITLVEIPEHPYNNPALIIPAYLRIKMES